MLPTQRIILGLDGRLLFASLLLFALLAFAYSATRRVRLLMALAPEPRFDRIGLLIGKTLEYAFAQKRMFRDLYAGIFHIFLFAGFVVLLARTVALVVEGLVPGYVLLRGPAGDFYTLAKDIFEVLVLIGVGMAVFGHALGAGRPRGRRTALAILSRRAPGDLRDVLVDSPGGHPLLRQLPAVLEALPHPDRGPQRFLHEARSDGAPRHAGPRSLGAFRRLQSRGPLLEVRARRLHLHGMRALPRRLPDRPDGKASRPEAFHRRPARRRLRGHAGDPVRRRPGWGCGGSIRRSLGEGGAQGPDRR